MQNYFSAVLGEENKKLEEFMVAIKKELDVFFGIDMWQPFVILLNSREDINKLKSRRTEDWLVGWASGCNIFILNEKNFTSESDHKDKSDFWKVLKHEYCHLYFKQITGGDYPRWLNEGLACFLAGQVKKEPSGEDIFKIFDYYDKSDEKTYRVGYFWVEILIEKFGKEKAIKLLKSLDSKTSSAEFAQKFKQNYGLEYGAKEFVNFLKEND